MIRKLFSKFFEEDLLYVTEQGISSRSKSLRRMRERPLG